MTRRTTSPRPGAWAARNCPKWLFSIFDAAERLHCSVRHARRLIANYRVPTGIVSRPVRLADGRIARRRLVTLTPSALEALLIAHAGLNARTDLPARTSYGDKLRG